MKNRLMQLAAGLALMAVLGKFYAVPMIAQVRAALIKNVDERGRSPYMVQAVCDPQGFVGGCVATFTAVPANRRLVVEYINGNITASHSGFFSATLFNQNARGFSLSSHLESANIGSNFDQYSVSVPVVLYYEAGQTPTIILGALGGAGNFTVSGYLVDLTQ